jgi:hypothetical protein
MYGSAVPHTHTPCAQDMCAENTTHVRCINPSTRTRQINVHCIHVGRMRWFTIVYYPIVIQSIYHNQSAALAGLDRH